MSALKASPFREVAVNGRLVTDKELRVVATFGSANLNEHGFHEG